MLSKKDIRNFRRDGFLLLKGFLSTDEVSRYARLMEESIQVVPGKWTSVPDLMGLAPGYWELATHDRLRGPLETLLGKGVKFLQVADGHRNTAEGGWHRDYSLNGTMEPPGKDDPAFSVVKCAFYIENDHAALGVVPGSHKIDRTDYAGRDIYGDPALVGGMWRKIKERRRGPLPRLIRASAGDVLIFDVRVLHAGCFLNAGGLPDRKERFSRKVLYACFGRDNKWSRDFYTLFRHVRKDLGYRGLDAALQAQLKEKGLYLSVMDQQAIFNEEYDRIFSTYGMPPFLERDENDPAQFGRAWYENFIQQHEKEGRINLAANLRKIQETVAIP